MRMKGSLPGPADAAGFNLQKLYYLSVHTFDSQENVKFAKNRVGRELLDLWVDRKITFGGISFQEDEQKLTETELYMNSRKTVFYVLLLFSSQTRAEADLEISVVPLFPCSCCVL